jgi:RNA polymerase sigma-70 factor (ECF subfamily)
MKLDRTKFDQLALEHIDLLYRIARRLTGSIPAAEDLVQDTYVRAFRARDDFQLESFGIRPWLVRIMHNLHVSKSQREQRQPAAVDEQFLDSISPKSGARISGVTSFDGMDEQLVRAVNDLPVEYQTALLLWAIEDFSYKEIADALEVPIGTVMSRLHRARARLSERLADFARKERIIRE